MTTPDPFSAFESERTIIKPKPRAGAPAGVGAQAAAPAPAPLPGQLGQIAILNPLVSAAAPLLLLAVRLRNLARPSDAQALRTAAGTAVQRFDAEARKAGCSNETVIGARYVLCTALDEAVGNTPWGVQSDWNKRSLLVQFHNETWGGEKVFQLLGRLAQDVPGNRPFLELIYCVLALGFEGRYRVIDNGRSQLEGVRQRLAELLRNTGRPHESDLSPHWRGLAAGGRRLRDSIPLWVIGTALLLLLALGWAGLQAWLNQHSDHTFSTVSSLQMPKTHVAPPPPPPAPRPRLARFLEPEIREGLVTVTDLADRSVIRLRGDHFFKSGSADPTPASQPVLKRVAAALADVDGEVLIEGHSDSQPIRSVRFPSNWHLSAARAEAVMAVLGQEVDTGRMRAVGKADAQPIAPNDTAENRALNRRVEITLITGQPGGVPPQLIEDEEP